MPEPRYTLRSGLLRGAEEIITEDRNKSYGEPDEDFQRIASLASAWGFRVQSGDKLRELCGSDVAIFMTCLKLARLSWNPTHRDSWLDIAGYAGCGYETAMLETERVQAVQPIPVEALVPVQVVNMLHMPPLSGDVLEAVQKALAGDPEELEDLGYFLGDAREAGQDCLLCDSGHTLRPPCRFRIQRRRNRG